MSEQQWPAWREQKWLNFTVVVVVVAAAPAIPPPFAFFPFVGRRGIFVVNF